MKSRDLLQVLAGQASIVAILVLVLFLSIAGAPILQQKEIVAQRIGADVAVSKAQAIAEAILAGADGKRTLESRSESFTAQHLPHALTQQGDSQSHVATDSFAARAINRLRADPSQPDFDFINIAGEFHLQYAVPDRAGGVLLLDLPLDQERAAIGRLFGQSYLSGSAVGYILIALLLFGSFCLRFYLRGLIRLPPDERRAAIEEGLRDSNPNQQRNLLPWMLTLCALVFAVDLSNVMDSVVGIGYVLAVILCLSSRRSWHITLIAGICGVLMFIAPIVSAYDGGWWTYLENHAVTIFAIIVTGLFGSAHMRKSRAAAIAMAEATQSRRETQALRCALERAENAEAERRDTAERMEMANEAAGISMWEWDTRTNIVRVAAGSAFVKRIGGATSYVCTDYAKDYVHPDDRQAYEQSFIDGLNAPRGGDDRIAHRYRLMLADATVQHIQYHGRILRNSGGKPTGILGVDWEVTREEQAAREIARQAEQLREAQERFQRAISGTQDALFEMNVRTGEIWNSPRFMQMLGYGEGATPADGRALLHPEDAPRVDEAIADHLQANAPFDIEYRLRQNNGDWLWVRSRAAAQRDTQGKPLWLAGSVTDITEARATREAMVRAAAEAEAASRSKSTFLATMSHEIRTPMNGVIGMTGLLLDTGLDRVQRDYAETIRASADSLLTILNDILDFSKIEAGKLDIEAIDLDLNLNVDDVGSIMAFQAAAKGLELVVNVRPEVPERVLGDPQRIRQCLLNLVGNAIKFTQSGEVVVEVCALGRQNGRSLVHFEVRDTGIGISPDSLAKLFQPFTQADSSTTRRFGGTGLGLSIVHKLVEMMGGQVGAQSEVGKGSAFWFTLPLESALGNGDEHRDPAAARGKRVLLVDDNETNRRVLAAQMTHAGYSVEAAACAADALALLRTPGTSPFARIFDVVVLDYQMPDMDGAMLGEQIMKDPRIAPTRLVLLTSLDRSGDIQRFSNIGFSAYLTKPVRTRELLSCLEKSLSRDVQDWHMRSQPIITRGTLIANETRRHYSGKVLLVEDNVINQRVARRFLERLGCEVQVVSDGLQAVEAYRREAWGFILMDMQMPVMDGLEATRRIRELENGERHTPIVALTANAMMGQLERCLEAGMDDYLTKPLDISRLQDVLDRFMGDKEHVKTATAPAVAPVADTAAAIRARLAEIADGDEEFASELVSAFILGGEETLREMLTAIGASNLDALRRAAHKLKGASANLHIHDLAGLALEVEAQAKAGQAGDWFRGIEKITKEFRRVSETLRAQISDTEPRKAG